MEISGTVRKKRENVTSASRHLRYNYGGGYVGYVAGKGKKHTFNLAESFAREKSGGKKVTYTNPIAVAKNGGWRYGYGNMFYVELVNQYLTVPQVSGDD